MSKSLKNFISITAVLERSTVRQLRLLFLNQKYVFHPSCCAEASSSCYVNFVPLLLRQVQQAHDVLGGLIAGGCRH